MSDIGSETHEQNPAQLLYDRLANWRTVPANWSIVDHRGENQESRPTVSVWYERVGEAVRWLDATKREAMRQEAAQPGPPFDLELVWQRCYVAILTPDNPGLSPQSQERQLVDAEILRTVAFVAAAWQQIHPADPQAYADVLDLVRRTRDLVTESGHLSVDTKEYIHRLTMHCETVLVQVRNRGATDVRQAATELAGALQIYYLDDKSEDQNEQQEIQSIVVRLKKRVETAFWTEFVPRMIGAGIDSGQRALEGPPAN